MMIFKIRKALEASVKRKFKADVTDAGTMLDGTAADFAFELEGREYDVQIKDTTEYEKKPKDTTQKQWVKGYKEWKDSKKKVISGSAYEINADGTEVENESTK